jgi:hypothetical protein
MCKHPELEATIRRLDLDVEKTKEVVASIDLRQLPLPKYKAACLCEEHSVRSDRDGDIFLWIKLIVCLLG